MKETKFIAIPDCHIPYEDKAALNTALEIAAWYSPDEIIILGDFLDMAPLSHWNRKNIRERKNLNMANDFKRANEVLDRIQKIAKKKVTYITGNHERFCDDVLEEQPELEGLIDVAINLKLKERKIELIPLNHCYTLGKLSFTHGLYTGASHAMKHVTAFERNIVYGHLHDVQLCVKVSPLDVEDKHMGLSLGCLAAKNPGYGKNRPNNWVHAVGVGMVRSDGNFGIDPVMISKGKASYAGKTFG